MSDKTGIEWTDATWNPVRGCTRVSQGCVNCYAETVAARFSDPGQAYFGLATRSPARWTGEVTLVVSAVRQPLAWKRPRKIFVNSMSDLFHEKMPIGDIDQIFAVMALAPQHTFQILTKRPQCMLDYLKDPFDRRRADSLGGWVLKHGYQGDLETLPWPLPNVWLGVSVENQETAVERIPLLLQTPAAKRFLSCEPLLGALDLRGACNGHYFFDALGGCRWHDSGDDDAPGGSEKTARIDWVICGGESGAKARPMHPDWARSLRDQCKEGGVPFFFKQWGEWVSGENDPQTTRRLGLPFLALDGGNYTAGMLRVGKKHAGRLLDGVEHSEFPVVA